jgi:hypothetical protein
MEYCEQVGKNRHVEAMLGLRNPCNQQQQQVVELSQPIFSAIT